MLVCLGFDDSYIIDFPEVKITEAISWSFVRNAAKSDEVVDDEDNIIDKWAKSKYLREAPKSDEEVDEEDILIDKRKTKLEHRDKGSSKRRRYSCVHLYGDIFISDDVFLQLSFVMDVFELLNILFTGDITVVILLTTRLKEAKRERKKVQDLSTC